MHEQIALTRRHMTVGVAATPERVEARAAALEILGSREEQIERDVAAVGVVFKRGLPLAAVSHDKEIQLSHDKRSVRRPSRRRVRLRDLRVQAFESLADGRVCGGALEPGERKILRRVVLVALMRPAPVRARVCLCCCDEIFTRFARSKAANLAHGNEAPARGSSSRRRPPPEFLCDPEPTRLPWHLEMPACSRQFPTVGPTPPARVSASCRVCARARTAETIPKPISPAVRRARRRHRARSRARARPRKSTIPLGTRAAPVPARLRSTDAALKAHGLVHPG